MKKITKILFAILLFLISTTVYADADYTYRTKKENRVKVNVQGHQLYMSVSVLFNMTGDFAQDKIPVENFTAEFKDDTFYVTVKRSELNKIFKEKTYDNVYSLFEISADFMDFKSDKQYFYVYQSDYRSAPGTEYTLTYATQDYLYRNYKILEIENSPASLIGYANHAGSTAGGGFVLYEADSLPEQKEYPEKYTLDELSSYTPIIKLDHRKSSITIIEDVQMDLGENKTIISEGGTRDETTGESKHDVIDINNYYAEYLENNKLSYSWTMYDTEGKPLEIKVDTLISMDNSENEEEILALFGNEFEDIKGRVKIISFKHEGDLNGTAKISLYVGDKFAPGSLVTLLYFNPDENALENPDFGEVELKEERYTVLVDNDGYIAMEMTHCSEYVVTEEEVAKKVLEDKKEETKPEEDKKEESNKKDKKNLMLALICCGAFVLVAIIVVIIIVKKKNNTKELTAE